MPEITSVTGLRGRFLTARAQFKDAEAKAESIMVASAGRPLTPNQILKLTTLYRSTDDACRRMLRALEDMPALTTNGVVD